MPGRVDTKLNGQGFKYDNTLWLIDKGQRRGIPSQETRKRLFVDSKPFPLERLLGDIEQGPGINEDASMINDGTTVYFFDNGEARGITSPAVLSKYGFHVGTQLQPSVVQGLPKGDVISD